jgi:hypothetical protein
MTKLIIFGKQIRVLKSFHSSTIPSKKTKIIALFNETEGVCVRHAHVDMIGLAVYTYSWLVRFIGRRLDLTGCMHGPVEVCTDRSTDRANLLKLIGWRQEEELFWFQRSKATRPPFIFPNIHCKFVTSNYSIITSNHIFSHNTRFNPYFFQLFTPCTIPSLCNRSI